MKDRNDSDEYKQHAPEITDDTELQELYDYMETQLGEPLHYNGCTVYDFSSHHHDPVALHEITEELEDGEYIIPFQVKTAWTAIWEMLPVHLRTKNFLMYRQNEQEYAEYKNFLGDELNNE